MLPANERLCIPVGNNLLPESETPPLLLFAPFDGAATPEPMRWIPRALFVAGIGATSILPLAFGASVPASGKADVVASAAPLAQRTVKANGHRMTLVRIHAPRMAKAAAASVASVEASAGALEAEERRATKASVFSSFTASVYAGPVTIVTWQAGEQSYQAYSNIDFRQLEGLSEIETATAVCSWFCIPFECDGETLPPTLLGKLRLSATTTEYVVDATESDMDADPEAFAVLDAIHSYYEENRIKLAARYEARRAEQAAQEAAAELNPPVQPDTTVYLWRNGN